MTSRTTSEPGETTRSVTDRAGDADTHPVAFAAPAAGARMFELARELFPIHRAVTGPGMRETLQRIGREIPLVVHEVPSGTQVFDWTVPEEWRIGRAFVEDEAGRRIVDVADCNLHIVNYSVPIDTTLSWPELQPHLTSLPEHPDWIPYRSTHFTPDWGFCIRHRLREELGQHPERRYRVVIESELRADGSLTYGEVFIPGGTKDEVLISAHACHPSLANDNLSGVVLATELARWAMARPGRRFSYRLVFIPATIGAITWLSRNEEVARRVHHGLVVSGVGDPGPIHYKKSRRGDAPIDRALAQVLRHSGDPHRLLDFTPFGYEERQYCSPGFDLPMGCFMRTPHGEYPEYHSSADDLELVRPEHLGHSFEVIRRALELLEANETYRNLSPKGEPQLGRRGLYQAFGSHSDGGAAQRAVQWVLNFSDGKHSLLDIAERASMDDRPVRRAADALVQCGLLEKVSPSREDWS